MNLPTFSNPEENIKALGIYEGMIIADLGAGTGSYTIPLAEKVGESGRVYAVEVQKEFLANIKNTAAARGLKNVEVFWGDIERLGGTKIKDGAVDAAVIANVLFQAEDKSGLIREAKRLHPEGEFIVGDATALLFPDESFDIAYSFAVIHHIPGDELRALFVREARRVLRPNGTLVLTTWDLWSPRHIGTLLANVAKNLLRFAPTNIKDIFLPLGKDHTLRYIHAFTRQELSALLAKNGFTVVNIEIIPHGKKESNIVVVAKRT